jgi:NADP-dependent 3-hydroxy acid dehydrogenase YdfG
MAAGAGRFSAAEPQSLEGRSVIVSGGSTGIGRAAVRVLCSQGARVLFFARNQEELNRALQEARDAGSGDAHAVQADVTRKEDIERVFAEADRHFGQLDILINNAAMAGGSVSKGSFEQWQQIVQTNIVGYIACCHNALERMKPRGEGHIVNVGSMSADLRNAGSDVYSATKSAIQALSESLRKSVNDTGIRISNVEPGAVATPLQNKTPEQQRERIENLEMLTPEDIAWAIHYCLIQPKRCDVVMLQVRPLRQLI